MTIPFSVILFAAQLVISVADGVPNFDYEKSCRAAATADAAANKQDTSGCVTDEKNARDTLGKEWAQFPPIDRGHCTQLATLGGTPSYVELLTCLEIARDTKKLPESITKSGLPKAR